VNRRLIGALSALALIGSRLVREITAVRDRIAGCARGLEFSTEPRVVGAVATLAAVEAHLDRLESQFEDEFDRELSAVSADYRAGTDNNSAAAAAGTDPVRKQTNQE
jgi:hypothetical protein